MSLVPESDQGDDQESSHAELADSSNTDGPEISSLRYVEHRRYYEGPLPPAELLREYRDLYPDAPRIIFGGYESQRQHRQGLERLVIETRCKAMLRGQWIAASLGAIGVLGGLVLIALGHGGYGVAFGSTVVVALVTTFIVGRESQKKEREEKAEIAEKIKSGVSPEDLQGNDMDRNVAEPEA